MNKSFLAKVKKNLLVEKRQVLKQTGQDINIDTDGDETDVVQGNMLIEMTNQLNTRNATKLSQIEEALKRLENKSYGLCLDCGELISEKRLLHNPYFQTCISCAEDREIEQRRKP